MSTTARIGAAVTGLAVAGVSDMPDFSGDHFTWEGSCWEAVTDPDLDVATMSPNASPAAKEALTARIVQAMSVATKKLVVTEEAILNHATLIGQTVVEDINVQGKLIGRDGVFTGTVDFENVNVTGTQIVNTLGANSISADKIKGGSFKGNTFEGGTFSGAEIRGTNVIGGVVKTSDSPGYVGGVVIDPENGIRGWDSTGYQTFQLSASDGSLNISQRLYATDTDNAGLVITPKTSRTGSAAIHFTSSKTNLAPSAAAAIWRASYEPEGVEPLHIRGAGGGHIELHGGLMVDGGGAMVYGNLYSSGELDVDKGMGIWGTSTLHGNLRVSGSYVYLDSLPTTSSAGNVRSQAGTGRLYVNTSSRRYKRNVVNWSPAPERVLALQPRQWQHDDPNFPEEIDERWHVGFVAEEVHELGLKGLVDYAGDGKGGWRPESLNYERFSAAQQVVLQKHEAEITELRERIALLEAQIGTA